MRPLAASFILAVALAGAARAAEPYDIHAINALTGNGAFLGQQEEQAMRLVEKAANATGGIAGRPVHFIFHDDQTTPQLSVQLAGEVLGEKPTVIFGSSLVATCRAMAPLMGDGPVMYCLSPGIDPPKGSYVFTTNVATRDLIAAQLRYFRLKGWRRFAVITSTDATGQEADQGIDAFLAAKENADITVVERSKFNPTDVSVAAQMERIKAARPQALIAWSTGAQIATIFRGVIQAGLDLPMCVSNGNMTYAQMTQYSGFLPRQVYMPSSLWPAGADPRVPVDAGVAAKQKEFYATYAAAGLKPDNASALGWDPASIVIDALRKIGPGAGAAQLRDYLVALKRAPGVHGSYDYTASPQRGLNAMDALVTLWRPDEKLWQVMSKPGGAPLD